MANTKNLFTFNIGSARVETNNINELRENVEQMKEVVKESGMEYVNHISDFIFSVEVAYQEWHELDCDDWEMIHKK